MVELPALRRAREIRQAGQASSRRATLDFQRACAGAAPLGVWLDEGARIWRWSRPWSGPVLGLASLFWGGKKVAPLGWMGKAVALWRVVQAVRKVWRSRKI